MVWNHGTKKYHLPHIWDEVLLIPHLYQKYQKIQYKNKKLTLCTNFSSNSKISSKVHIFLFWISLSSSSFVLTAVCQQVRDLWSISQDLEDD